MHLWPSLKLRDSFKIAYLQKLEWNLHRMNSEKRSQQNSSSDNNQRRLLDGDNSNKENGVVEERFANSKTLFLGKAVFVCREILMVLSCCYCCFCCGACVQQDED